MEDELRIVRLTQPSDYIFANNSSDQGWMDVPSLKIGPGNSARSPIAKEYIFVKEIDHGINAYIRLLNDMMYCLVITLKSVFTINFSLWKLK